MNRRQFLQASVAAAASGFSSSLATTGPTTLLGTTKSVTPPPNKLPRWRGFNFVEMVAAERARDFKESDFEMIAEWGFDFVRVPASYLCWSSHVDWMEVREKPLLNLDRAVSLGRSHGIHINLNLHRLPGYCVNPPLEPASLWTDSAALNAAAHQWGMLAKRYKEIPSTALSFDLINEPANIHADVYTNVVTRLVEAIRAESPDRLIIADGLQWGRLPVPELISLNIGQSARGYDPHQLSHYQANWVKGSDKWPVPTWPLQVEKQLWDKSKLQQDQQPWLKLQSQGVGVHVGEWGSHNRTPHPVVLAWMQDNLELWKSNGWGWALWNLYGNFGILDSGRTDVKYESYKGHQLDKAMLDLLRSF